MKDFQGFLSDYEGLWRILRDFNEGYWGIFKDYGGFWGILMKDFQGFLSVYEGFWRVLRDFEGLWGIFEWLRRISRDFNEGFWRAFDEFWGIFKNFLDPQGLFQVLEGSVGF